MVREEPILKKCCVCIPLRLCLHTWAVLKAVADIMASLVLLFLILLMRRYYRNTVFSVIHVLGMIIAALMVDVIFMIVLIVGSSKKHTRTLKVFYYYSFYMLAMEIIIVIAFLVCLILEIGSPTVLAPVIVILAEIISLGIDIFIIIILKSEMIKLRNKEQYDFVPMPTLKVEDFE